MLFVAEVGLDEAPGIVEFGLQANKLAFFFVLGAEDVQFVGLEGRLCVRGVYRLVSAGGAWSRIACSCTYMEGSSCANVALGVQSVSYTHLTLPTKRIV